MSLFLDDSFVFSFYWGDEFENYKKKGLDEKFIQKYLDAKYVEREKTAECDKAFQFLTELPKQIQTISEKYLTEILKQVETNGIPYPRELGHRRWKWNREETDKYKWGAYFWILTHVEAGFTKSADYSFEKATKVFKKHIREIQKQGFDINEMSQVRKENVETYSPIGIAVMNQCPALLATLIEAGARMSIYIASTASPLNCVKMNNAMDSVIKFSEEQTVKCIDILATSGCDLNVPLTIKMFYFYIVNETLLWRATRYNHKNVITALVNAKADINLPLNNDCRPTVLHRSIDKDINMSTTELLVRLGADLFALNKDETAIDLIDGNQLKNYSLQWKRRFLQYEIEKFIDEAYVTLDKVLIKPLINIVIEYLNKPVRRHDLSGSLSLSNKITLLPSDEEEQKSKDEI